MRMAYAYQYLFEQKEKAIPYVQWWAEPDSEDENVPAVTRECQGEIVKRGEAKTDGETGHAGVSTGFVLLSRGEWDRVQFIRDMGEKWNIPMGECDASEDKSDDALIFKVGGMVAAVSLAACSIPGGEVEANAEDNYMWEDAIKAAREHRAHIMVAVPGEEEDALERGRLYTELAATHCHQKYATDIYTSGMVSRPHFYEGLTDMMREGELPIFN